MEAGIRVRLVGDPTRVGVTTGQSKPQRDRKRIQIVFPDATQWVPETQLETIKGGREAPSDLLLARKLGKPVDLRRTLTHVRLNGKLADVIYSMEATNTDFYAYQFKPVLKLLHSASNGILIADEVGLGKTIEAGLIWTELRSRFDMRRLLVLCPSILREKWVKELYSKIGVEARLAEASDVLKVLQDPSSTHRGFAMVCSLQGLRPRREWDDPDNKSPSAQLARFLQDQANDEQLIDLLIVDEAHYLRNPATKSNKLGELLRDVSEYAAFLTATPIHNKNADLFAVLKLLDPNTFQRPGDFDDILKANRPLVKARDSVLSGGGVDQDIVECLRDAERHPLLQGNRQIAAIQDYIAKTGLVRPEHRSYAAYRLESVNLLGHVVTRTRKRDVKEWRVVREPIAERVPLTEAESTFYHDVTRVVTKYSLDKKVNEHFLLVSPQRQMSSSMPAALKSWLDRKVERDPFDFKENDSGLLKEEEIVGPLTQILIESVGDSVSLQELTENDSKYARLADCLKQYFSDHPDEKVILFSTYRATLHYLGERLTTDGITNLIMTGESGINKHEVMGKFQFQDDIRVLLSSEVGSEGVDLQFSRVVINYDLPWNPMRVEQRIGRIDRLGQKADKVLIWNLFYEDTIDSRIYDRLYEKLDLCNYALGDFEVVLGDEIRQLTYALLSDQLSPEQQERRIDQTAQALATLRLEEEKLEKSASQLTAYGDYILHQVQVARDLHRWITDDDLQAYVMDFLKLNYSGCDLVRLQPDTLNFEISLSLDARNDLSEFMRQHRLTFPTQLLKSPSIRCKFENRVSGVGFDRVESISQFHPLVRFVGEKTKQSEMELRPAVAVKLEVRHVPKDISAGDYVVVASLWSVDGIQATEKLVFLGAENSRKSVVLAPEQSEQLAISAAMHGTEWPEGRTEIDVDLAYEISNDELLFQLSDEFEVFLKDMNAQNEDRIQLQERTLKNHLEIQRGKLNETKRKHIHANRESLAKATDGKIRKLEDSVNRQQAAINSNRNPSYRSDEVCVAIVRVE
jgi:superfamily II DNA or RNA helicase